MRVEPYWISHQAAGRLAIIPRPRPNDWLEDELLAWKRADIEIVVSCLTGFEVMALGLQKEKAMCEENQMHFVSFPIEDRQVPASQIATLDLTRELLGWLNEGKTIAIHCRQGWDALRWWRHVCWWRWAKRLMRHLQLSRRRVGCLCLIRPRRWNGCVGYLRVL